MPPPPSRRFAQRPRTGRTTATVQRPGTGRQQARGRSGTALRGTGRKTRVQADNPTLGIISTVCFVLFWVFIMLALNGLLSSAVNHDPGRMMASAGLGLFSYIFPFAGLATGIAGVIHRRSQRVMAWIGVVLNGGLLLFFLVSILANHH